MHFPRLFLIIILNFSFLFSHAQNWCGTDNDYPKVNHLKLTKDVKQGKGLLKSNIDIPVYVHFIGFNDSTYVLDSAYFSQTLSSLNGMLDSAGIKFSPCQEIKYLYSDKYADMSAGEMGEIINVYGKERVLNVFVVPILRLAAGVSMTSNGKDAVILMTGQFNLPLMAHEFGHFMGLRHTFQDGNELVNGSNCETAGDYVCDTPADPNWWNSDCSYRRSDSLRDANGDLFQPDSSLFMAYSNRKCRDRFTIGQLERSKVYLLNYKSHFSCENLCIERSYLTGNAENPTNHNGWIKANSNHYKDSLYFRWSNRYGYQNEGAYLDSIFDIAGGWYNVEISDDSCTVYDSVYVGLNYGCTPERETVVLRFNVRSTSDFGSFYWTVTDTNFVNTITYYKLNPRYPSRGTFYDTLCLVEDKLYKFTVQENLRGSANYSSYEMYCALGGRVLINNGDTVINHPDFTKPPEYFTVNCNPYIHHEIEQGDETAFGASDGWINLYNLSSSQGEIDIEWQGPNNFYSQDTVLIDLANGWYYLTLSSDNNFEKHDSVYIGYPGCQLGTSQVIIKTYMNGNTYRNWWKLKSSDGSIIKETIYGDFRLPFGPPYDTLAYDTLCLFNDSTYFFEVYNNKKRGWGGGSQLDIYCIDSTRLAFLSGVDDPDNDSLDLRITVPFTVSCNNVFEAVDLSTDSLSVSIATCSEDSVQFFYRISNVGYGRQSTQQLVSYFHNDSLIGQEYKTDTIGDNESKQYQSIPLHYQSDSLLDVFGIRVEDSTDFILANNSIVEYFDTNLVFWNWYYALQIYPDSTGNCTGSINIDSISGGISPYSVLINDSIISSPYQINDLCSGTYLLTIEDSMGCRIQDTITIENFVGILNSGTSEFGLYPNPVNKYLSVTLPYSVNTAEITVYDETGRILLRQNLNDSVTIIDCQNWKNGIYPVKISSAKFIKTYRVIKGDFYR